MTTTYNTQQEPFIWLDFEIDDFNVFEELVHSWSIDFLQLDGGTFYSQLQQLIFPEVQIGHTHFDCHLDQKGSSPDNMWTFVIMGEDASMFNYQHTKTESTSTMVLYSPGQEINAVSYEGFHIYTFSVHVDHMKQLLAHLGMDEIEEKLKKIDRVELDHTQADALRKQLQGILNNAAAQEEKLITAEGKYLILNYLPTMFLKEIGTKLGCAKEKVKQNKAIHFLEARAYIHTYLREQITVEDVAKKFQLSERSLRNYFKEELNTSPKKYLTALRLRKVRDELKAAKTSKGLIEKTARKFGFQHMGQFSKAYKEHFKELPSETLKKPKL